MEYCPECGNEARTDVTYCPGCGTDLTEYREWASTTDAGSGPGATAEQVDSPANGSGDDPMADAAGDDAAATQTAADEGAPTETDAGAAGSQQKQGQTEDAGGRGGEPRTNQSGEPRQDQPDGSQRESGHTGNQRANRRQGQNQQGQGAGQPTSGQGGGHRGNRNANRPRGQPQGGQPQGAQPRNGAQGGRGAPSPQGGQPGRGQQAGAPNQPRQGQGAPAGAGAAPAPGAVNQGPSLLDRVKALPFKQSAAVGAGLYVVSFLLAYVTFIVDALAINGSGHDLSVSNLLPLTSVSAGNSLDMWQLVGWLLYSGHNVAIERSVDGSTEAVEVLGEEFWAQFAVPQLVTPVLYSVIPLVILAAGGLAFVKYLDGNGTAVTETTDAALLGASILVGYVVLAVVGTFLVSISDGGASTGPVLQDTVLWSALFAGGAGAAGGVAAHSLGDDTSSETAPPSDTR